ncbi:Uncharacterised protein [Mycobacteroides abscessus]|nr:Uncharacterised protein [Mycobacteroides abscessus]
MGGEVDVLDLLPDGERLGELPLDVLDAPRPVLAHRERVLAPLERQPEGLAGLQAREVDDGRPRLGRVQERHVARVVVVLDPHVGAVVGEELPLLPRERGAAVHGREHGDGARRRALRRGADEVLADAHREPRAGRPAHTRLRTATSAAPSSAARSARTSSVNVADAGARHVVRVT